MKIRKKTNEFNTIPTKLTESEFNEFILPHLSKGTRGPECGIPLYKVFNYILRLVYTGEQWASLPIDKDEAGRPEIHYTRIFRICQRWINDGSLIAAFKSSVLRLDEHHLLDLSILHGDGSTSAAKKGGDNIGFNGHKRMKGEKVVAVVDRNANVISPFTVAPGNAHECTLFDDAFRHVKDMFNELSRPLKGIVMSLDSAYDSLKNRKSIFNAGMVPNIKENPRGRKQSKAGRKRFFNQSIYEERFQTVERTFAWEDKFKRLLLRFERNSRHHFGLKLIAYTMINLRHFCNS